MLEARSSVTIHGKHTYEANVSDNALGTISSLEHAVGTFDARLHEREADVNQYNRQSEDLAEQLNQPFEHEEKLSAATKRQHEIVAALDITKNQAAANVDEGADNSETVQEKSDQTVREGKGVARGRPV